MYAFKSFKETKTIIKLYKDKNEEKKNKKPTTSKLNPFISKVKAVVLYFPIFTTKDKNMKIHEYKSD